MSKAASIPNTDDHSAVLVEVDAELAHAIPDADREVAARLSLPFREVVCGDTVTVQDCESALLLVRGVLWSETRVGTGCAPQLLTAGSVILSPGQPPEYVQSRQRIVALTPARLAAIEPAFMAGLSRWPGITQVLRSRLAEQQHDLAVQAAIGQLPRVEDRILAFLWRMAERCGTVGRAGVRVPLQLTHERLGLCVGAQRSTVSLALTTLRERRLVARDDDGSWLLPLPPPTFGPEGTTAESLPLYISKAQHDGSR